MAPEMMKTMEANELREIAAKVFAYQQTKKLSDVQLLKRFAGLGSTKTYKRILANDLEELDLERQLNNYRSALALIESMGEETQEDEELYDDLFPVIQLRRAFVETMRENSIARLIVLQGPTGSGKSTARRLLLEKYGHRLLQIEATVAWNDSPMAMLSALLDVLGVREKPQLQVDRLQRTIHLLCESRKCLLIEEAHHLGPRCLNLVKTLINNTPGEFVFICIDTLLKKLESNAYEEARQLTGNRLAERISLGRDLRESDVRKVLERRVKTFANGDLKQAVRIIMDKAANYGRFSFVRDVCKRVNEKADGEAVTAELFAQAVQEEVMSR